MVVAYPLVMVILLAPVFQEFPEVEVIRQIKLLKGSFERKDKSETGPVVTVFLTLSDLNPENFPDLARLRELRDLHLTLSKLSNSPLKKAEGMSMKRLAMSFTNANDDDLASVSTFKGIEKLELAATKITDKGIMHLSRLANLANLDLTNTEISDDGIAQLGQLRHLTHLSLLGTAIEGKSLKKLLPPSGVESLNLGSTKVNDEVVLAIQPLLKQATWLSLASTKVTDKSVRSLGSLDKLKTLHLSYNSITDFGAEILTKLASLEDLSLAQTKITGKTLSKLAEHKRIRELDISNTDVSDEALVHLGKMQSLRSVNLIGCKLTEAALDEFISKNANVFVQR